MPQGAGPTGDEGSQFRVFVLGTRGSGKTLLLSALYHQLSVQSREAGFQLELPEDEDRIFLIKLFNQIADREEPWPRGTMHSEIKEYEFRGVHSSNLGRFPLFTFTYIDYPGGTVEGDVVADDEELVFIPREEAERADAVIGLLDGQKILHLLRGEEGSANGLRLDLSYLLTIIGGLQWKSISFVVTKWDVLQAEYSLEQVRNALLQFSQFGNLVEQRRGSDKPIHLIPVSAVGNDFAVLDEKRIMRKRQDGGNADPFQVEMTLIMTLTDELLRRTQELKSLGIAQPISAKNLWQLPISILRYCIALLSLASSVAAMPTPFRIKQPVLSMILQALDYKLEQRSSQLKREAEAALNRINDERTALEAVIIKQAVLRSEFERDFPHSNLTRS